ncbi:MAG: hypothetical protein KC609_05505, partial [Myxococcales bacterium]|nr:hypothetical protein [Myxococcales bacterium]
MNRGVVILIGVAIGLTLGPLSAARAQTATKQWRSGFESGFPGEWLNYDNGSFNADGVLNGSNVAGWTIVGKDDVPGVPFGEHVYKGWIVASDSASHRAYPVIHVDIPSPLVNRFWVWLDVDYDKLGVSDWVHFATFGNNPDWTVHTMSVRDRKLEMAHLDWSYVGPKPQPDFPLRQWVRFSVYIHYPPAGDGTVIVWQDGVKVLVGTWSSVDGNNLMRAHWGMYAAATVSQGVQYNDEIQIWSLSAPLIDRENEPPSPYDDVPMVLDGPDADTTTGSDATDVTADWSGPSDQSPDDVQTPSDAQTPADTPSPDQKTVSTAGGCQLAQRSTSAAPWLVGLGLLLWLACV